MPGIDRVYNKNRLLELLRAKCPDALYTFPDPSTFEFQVIHGKTYLLVGKALDEDLVSYGTAWITDLGTYTPKMCVRTINGGYVSKESYPYVAGSGVFSDPGGPYSLDASCDWIKALATFVFVDADKSETFVDFDHGMGLQLVVYALQDICFCAIEEIRDPKKRMAALAAYKEKKAQLATKEDPLTCEPNPKSTAGPSDREIDSVEEPSEYKISIQKPARKGKKRALSPASGDEVLVTKKPRINITISFDF